MVFETLVACMDKLAIHPIGALWATVGIEETTRAWRGYRWALNPLDEWQLRGKAAEWAVGYPWRQLEQWA